MRTNVFWRALRTIVTIVAALLITAVAGASVAQGADEQPQEHKILTFRATTRQYVAVTPAELKPGHIYSHYDERLGRQVWSICKADKTFWHALAAGSCQAVHLFDWDVKTQTEESEAYNRLKELDPGIYRQVLQEGAAIFVELKPDGHWRLTKTSVPTVRDAETGRHWEWQFGRYIPVRRTSYYQQ